MEDSIQVVTESESVSVRQQNSVVSSESMSSFGWMQFVQCILVSLAMFFDAQQTFLGIFADDYPSWHCDDTTTCTSVSDICKLPKSSWSWNGPSSKTIISHWGLECASSFVTGLPQSSFFFGCLFGSFVLAALADTSLGRKNMLFLSCLSMSVTSLVTIFSPNVWIYSALKFLTGFWRSSIPTCVLVLLTERVSTEWRFTVGIVEYFCFLLGYMSLPAIAYVNRHSSWKLLYVWTSVPAICYPIIAFMFVAESPRWLLMQGRKQEAMTKRGASVFLQLYSSIAELFGKRWALKRMIAVMVIGLGVGMVYFGMPLAVGNLGSNLYFAVVFTASMEISSCIVLYFLENHRRKLSILAFSIGSGVCSIICVVMSSVHKAAKVALAMASFFGACTAYNLFLIYIVELFPTSVRNTATSLARQAIAFGCIFCPFFISEGRKNDIFSYGVFGIVIICSNFALVCLPETKGIALCDTMDQQEKKETSLSEMANKVINS